MSDLMEVVHRLEREMADRASQLRRSTSLRLSSIKPSRPSWPPTRRSAALTTMTASLTLRSPTPLMSTFAPSTGSAVSASTVVSVRSIRLRSTSLPHGHGSKVEEGRIRSSSRTIGVRPDTSVWPFSILRSSYN